MVPPTDLQTWVPYWNTSPPPPLFDFHDQHHSGPHFPPLVIAIIEILATAFMLITYYAIMSKYFKSRIRIRIPDEPNTGSSSEEENPNTSKQKNGLDEERINSIAIFKYKKGSDGLIDGFDCSVCLGEFQDDESLRVLPKCSHAFHVTCIDKWLKSHSNCPLCRANIVIASGVDSRNYDQERNSAAAETQFPVRDFNHSVISMADLNQEMRRSMSMNCDLNEGRLSVADILRIDQMMMKKKIVIIPS